MKKQTSLHIATPCHANWNGMTPTEKGKFCSLCSHQVIDFTTFSDHQVLRHLASHSGALCGRFEAHQLGRPLTEITLTKKRSWYMALAMPLLLIFQKNYAQPGSRTMGKPSVKTEHRLLLQSDTEMLVAPVSIPKWITLYGTVKDEKGNPATYASIIEKGTSYGVASDSAGSFSIQIPANADTITLVASLVGYNSIEKRVSVAEADSVIELEFTVPEVTLGEVVVTGYASRRLTGLVGAVSICRKVTYMEKADSAFRKITGSQSFTIYPNPALSGSEVQIKTKKQGHYELQLLSGNSVLLKTENIYTDGDEAISSFRLMPHLAAGVYYLRLIDTGNKKSFLEKIMVR